MEPAYAETVLQEAKLQAEESEKLLRQAHDEEPPQVPYFQARTRVMEGGCDEVAFDLPVPLPQPPTDLVKAETDDELPTPCLSPNEAVLSSGREQEPIKPPQEAAQEPPQEVAQEPPQKVAQEPTPSQEVEAAQPAPISKDAATPSEEVELVSKPDCVEELPVLSPKEQEQHARDIRKLQKDGEAPKPRKGKGKGKKNGKGKGKGKPQASENDDPEPKAKPSEEAMEEDEEPQPKAAKKKRSKAAKEADHEYEEPQPKAAKKNRSKEAGEDEEPQPKASKKKRSKEAKEEDEEPQPKVNKKKASKGAKEDEEPQPKANKKNASKEAKQEHEDPQPKVIKKKKGAKEEEPQPKANKKGAPKETDRDAVLEERRMRNCRKSKAYHGARNAALKSGLSADEAKKKAQEVSCMTCMIMLSEVLMLLPYDYACTLSCLLCDHYLRHTTTRTERWRPLPRA